MYTNNKTRLQSVENFLEIVLKCLKKKNKYNVEHLYKKWFCRVYATEETWDFFEC